MEHEVTDSELHDLKKKAENGESCVVSASTLASLVDEVYQYRSILKVESESRAEALSHLGDYDKDAGLFEGNATIYFAVGDTGNESNLGVSLHVQSEDLITDPIQRQVFAQSLDTMLKTLRKM